MPDIAGKPLRIDQLVTVLQPHPTDRYHAKNGLPGVIVHVYPWGNTGMAVIRLKSTKPDDNYIILDGCELRINSGQNMDTGIL